MPRVYKNTPPLGRLMAKVHKTDTCWLWQGGLVKGGYGVMMFDTVSRVQMVVSKASYILHKGGIPNGMQVCHECDTPACVNPDHLFLGTAKENKQDQIAKGREPQSNKTVCKRGHAYTPENTVIAKTGARTCRICKYMLNAQSVLRNSTNKHLSKTA